MHIAFEALKAYLFANLHKKVGNMLFFLHTFVSRILKCERMKHAAGWRGACSQTTPPTKKQPNRKRPS